MHSPIGFTFCSMVFSRSTRGVIPFAAVVEYRLLRGMYNAPVKLRFPNNNPNASPLRKPSHHCSFLFPSLQNFRCTIKERCSGNSI